MKTKTLLLAFLLMILCASAQDFTDYSKSDPDNIVNSIDTTIPTLKESIESLKESKKKFEYIYETTKNVDEYKAVEESNTVDGIKKDSNSFVEWFINTSFVKWVLGTETAKGIKKDMNKEVKKEHKKEVKATPKNKNVD